jgi:hypothetical protein
MPTDWTALLLAAGTGGLAATLISAFAKYWAFRPVISVRLDAKKGSYGQMTLYGASDEARALAKALHGTHEAVPHAFDVY